jgi:hypothetical protein
MESTSTKNGTYPHSTTGIQISTIRKTRHRQTKKTMERDTTVLEAGTGDSPNPLNDDDDDVCVRRSKAS